MYTQKEQSVRPFSKFGTYLFNTCEGYGEGKVISSNNRTTTIEWVRHSQPIVDLSDHLTIDSSNKVIPNRLNPDSVTICSSDQINGYGYIKPGSFTKPSQGVSGYCGEIDSTRTENVTQIKNGLTLHNEHHQELLTRVNSYLHYYTLSYLKGENIPNSLINELTWTLNLVLYIDDFPVLPQSVISETIHNFLLDYTHSSDRTWLRSPLNYLFDPIQIDGLIYLDSGIVFLPSYQANISYHL